MIIRKPTPADLPRLSRLWQEAFGDSPEEVESFYATAFSCDRALLAEAQNPIACIYWIDAQIAGRRIAYLYAFSVEKACRSQGVGKTLLRKTLQSLKEEGYGAAVLVPGEESLRVYYEKLGFTVFGVVPTPAAEAPGMPVTATDCDTYLAKRNKLHPALQWEKSAFVYLEKFCRFYTGENWVLALDTEGVQEFIGDPKDLPHILYALNVSTEKTPVAMAYAFTFIEFPGVFGPVF